MNMNNKYQLYFRTQWVPSQRRLQFKHDCCPGADWAPQITASFTRDRLTGTQSGGSLDRTESVPKWSRKRRACAGLMVDGTKTCARQAFTILHCPLTFYSHINAQIFVQFIYTTLIWVVTGETISIRFKYKTIETTKQPSLFFRFSRKMAWQDTTAWLHLTHRYLVNAVRGHKTGSNSFSSPFFSLPPI